MNTINSTDNRSFPEYCTPFLDSVERSFSSASFADIREALHISIEKLEGITRYSGVPFAEHPVNTAKIVAEEVGLGRNSVVAALLHDPVRVGAYHIEEAERRFGHETAAILKGLCSISEVDTKRSEEQIDNFKELILSYSADPRVILIKIADRLEVMRSLGDFPAAKREKKSWETLNLYAQIAHKLGLYSIKSEMEDLCLKSTHPADYDHIVKKLADTDEERRNFIARFLEPITAKLDHNKFNYTVKSRTKSIYSIWKKMKKTGVTFEEVYDVFAIRIVIDCDREAEKSACWGAFSIVTDFYTPNPERMRDWISIPKSNGYESLHTTVVTGEGKWVEVQIRTRRMDEVAERGVAAHWRYKGVKQGGLSSEEWFAKLRGIMESAEGDAEISDKIDARISSKEIFVFTPNGDLRKLPDGATVLDFAFDIHTKIGTACTGARINLRNVSIREHLRNGDVVEILTSKNQKPKPDWLNIVVTGKARQRIKVFLREEKAKESLLGRETLERKMKNWKVSMNIEECVNILCKFYKLKTGTELYALISEGKANMQEIRDILTGNLTTEGEAKPRGEGRIKTESDNDGALIIDESLGQVSYKLAKCCNPIFGDDIFGFVTVSAGITIHRSDCPNAVRLVGSFPYRVLKAKWRSDQKKGSFLASVKIQAEDKGGLVNKITEVISRDLKINIRSMNLGSASGILSGMINIEVTSSQVVDMVVYSLMRIKGVQKAFRVNK